MVSPSRKFIVGGNFKMNGTSEMLKQLVEGLNAAKIDGSKTDVVICPPFLYLLSVKEHADAPIQVGAQNLYPAASGAFTGELSPCQLKDAGIPWVILGHSERRAIFKESDEFVAKKVEMAVKEGLKVIFCVGETLEEREAGKTMEVVQRQTEAVVKVLKEEDWSSIVIAYEPVWAIGTGKVASKEQAQEVHAALRQWLAKTVSKKVADEVRIQYGGSVSGKNCVELAAQPDIDGFLVGGASLKPEFIDICRATDSL